jgi:thiamine biosynthesis lipoprotein
MKKISPHQSPRWLAGAAAGLATFTGGERLAAAPWIDVADSIRRAAEFDLFRGGFEGVLGTSLDLTIEAPRHADAAECAAGLLGEIERLRRILSTYDPGSEIRRVMAGATVESAELAELLAAYEKWAARTGGLIDVNLGGVIGEWREAARAGRWPERAVLAAAARKAREWNVDALGKGFIIDRAVAVARRLAPGGLLNLGGDIRAWGDTAWEIGVADPRNPADNAPPIARFALREAAVATSGGYARGFTIGGRRFSHLIDPRTQWPLAVGGSATVVAPDAVTANALSTAASIGGAACGAELAKAHGVADYLFVDAAGEATGGGLLAASCEAEAEPEAKPKPDVAAAAKWPAGFQVNVQVALKTHTGAREVYRPYVAVWIEDEQRQVVRTLTVWGQDERWQRRMGTWWRQIRDVGAPYSVTRATRAPGAYEVVWNGADDSGRRLPAGNYTVRVEICREHGGHVVAAASIACGAEPVTVTLAETAESAASTISYGRVKAEVAPK